MNLLLTPFIMLDGNAKEAIEFYQEALGAQVVFLQTFGEGPQNPDRPLSEEAKKRVAHSVLQVGGADLFVSDCLPSLEHQAGNQVNICITTSHADDAKQLYEALQQNGQVKLPLQEIHFSPAYGIVTDKFGVTFQIFTKRAS